MKLLTFMLQKTHIVFLYNVHSTLTLDDQFKSKANILPVLLNRKTHQKLVDSDVADVADVQWSYRADRKCHERLCLRESLCLKQKF